MPNLTTQPHPKPSCLYVAAVLGGDWGGEKEGSHPNPPQTAATQAEKPSLNDNLNPMKILTFINNVI